MYNVAVVGSGVVGDRLADAFEAHEATTVHAGCDVVESKAESFADEYDCAAYTDHAAMIAEGAVDIVYVGVPPKAHRGVVEAAVDAVFASEGERVVVDER